MSRDAASPIGAYPQGVPTGLPITLPPPKDLADFCRKSRIQELGIYGRVFEPDFPDGAPVEVLVRFRRGQFVVPAVSRVEAALTEMFAHPVKLIERAQVEVHFNPVLNQRLLKTLRLLFFEY